MHDCRQFASRVLDIAPPSSAKWLNCARQTSLLSRPLDANHRLNLSCRGTPENSTSSYHSMQIMQFIYSLHSFHFKLIAVGALVAVMLAPEVRADDQPQFQWFTDYHEGLDQAEQRGALALIWFYDPHSAGENERFANGVIGHAEITDVVCERFVAIKLPRDVKITSAGEEIKLLDHSAFDEMQGSAGLAIVDMCEPGGPLFRHVVSVYPFKKGPISAEKLAVMLELPRGTLTQRTLIFAVRTNAESPASTTGALSPILVRETESHARHQARITLQGHHNWNTRFQSINAQLPGGLLAREVCAESWPGQDLLDAANECVHSWRQSPGHWSAVRGRHPLFGYDMQRGANGVWYATGIFADRAN